MKWHPTNPSRLLIAAMHNGFSVVDFDGISVTPSEDGKLSPGEGELKKRFEGHDSLAYGVDWSDGGQTSSSEDIVASCSFYDHAMHVWSV